MPRNRFACFSVSASSGLCGSNQAKTRGKKIKRNVTRAQHEHGSQKLLWRIPGPFMPCLWRCMLGPQPATGMPRAMSLCADAGRKKEPPFAATVGVGPSISTCPGTRVRAGLLYSYLARTVADGGFGVSVGTGLGTASYDVLFLSVLLSCLCRCALQESTKTKRITPQRTHPIRGDVAHMHRPRMAQGKQKSLPHHYLASAMA